MGYGQLTEGTMHTVEGMVMILAGFGVMGLEIQLLDWLWVGPSGNSFPGKSVRAGGAL